MKYFRHAIIPALAISSLTTVAMALPAGIGPLTFEDQFDGAVLDPTKWIHRASGPRFDGVLSPTAVSVGGGVLTIKAYTETVPVTGEQIHIGGQIATANLFEQQYGYFESRVRFHATSGTASAFWLQSPTHGNPQGNPQVAGVEVDIFEHRVVNPFDSFPPFNQPYDVANNIHNALIWDGYPTTGYPTLTNFTPDIPTLINNDPNDTWHTSGLLWGPDGYTFFFDDVAIWNLTPSQAPVSMRTEYMLLSLEIFEAFAGDIPAGGYGSLEETTTNVQFDYVRAYALTPEPSGLGLALIGAMAALARRRRLK